jgi:hypothetical protein
MFVNNFYIYTQIFLRFSPNICQCLYFRGKVIYVVYNIGASYGVATDRNVK